MPRFIITSRADASKNERLVKKRAQELRTPSSNVQPLILEERVPSTKSRHVRVIWDAWKDLGDEQRSAVITNAYAEADGQQAAEDITIAEGLLPQEALALGLLPFKVVPTRRKNDSIPAEAYQKALAGEARNTVLGPKANELRFARVEDAEEAAKRLQKALPTSS
jgi:hypothetical protein